jgi:hypothetical protein
MYGDCLQTRIERPAWVEVRHDIETWHDRIQKELSDGLQIHLRQSIVALYIPSYG